MKKSIIVVSVFILMVACGSGSDSRKIEGGEVSEKPVPDMHTSETSLDYTGIYTGILPCDDCEGIQVRIELGKDGRYSKSTQYAGRNDPTVLETQGAYSWNDAGNIITLEGSLPPNQYFVGENMLIQLDIEGQRIMGELQDSYVLEKKT